MQNLDRLLRALYGFLLKPCAAIVIFQVMGGILHLHGEDSDFLSGERSLLIPPYLTIFPSSHDHIVVLYGRVRRGGGKGGRGGVGKIVKYGGMSNDRSSDKKSHKVRFEQALFKQIDPQLLYGLPVDRVSFSGSCLKQGIQCHIFVSSPQISSFPPPSTT